VGITEITETRSEQMLLEKMALIVVAFTNLPFAKNLQSTIKRSAMIHIGVK